MRRFVACGPVLVLVAGLLGACGDPDPGAVGTWGEQGEGEPQLVIADDGTVSGTDGCNQLNGEWSQDDEGTVRFEPFASTQMACEGVDTWLTDAAWAEVDGDELVLHDTDDEQIGSLARAS
ncbi:META domain-containing protein [Cellulomonas fimi]|uniref:DUF306 domain-containing protein n=1 Tax=Cellulomonas fimi (strain ATCC 484 / DSM 20113 / JCM 1341 / CCUG 24087 / LMG 16345 / NBRC 15513 / NCIMB 8980 / NCTC 7547 / NRS-133) TaxID=590998 RepID=F4H7X5_CELFA|nr:META domain-containing protein [Cellulomonas fimi]AEE46936.1 protein of unknown function DUF306 Meta and HslJ [Cellulomonas fimi ATCC 484]NNH07883.1 META domain-containing protein [Cellulomonas fimi]VEH34615.1 META domain [Cellulomonas fimi]